MAGEVQQAAKASEEVNVSVEQMVSMNDPQTQFYRLASREEVNLAFAWWAGS